MGRPANLPVGKVLKMDKSDTGRWYHPYTSDEPIHLEEGDELKYPAVLSKLEWWEERTPEELEQVKFAKTIAGNSVRTVNSVDSVWGKINLDGGKIRNIKHWIPATESEYNQYQSSKK